MIKTLFHVHSHAHTGDEGFWETLLHHVFLDALYETLLIIPFLFLAYLLMEFIEHRASEKTVAFLAKSGNAGPAVGGLLGIAPQCAFSAMASNLYAGRVITLGTLLAVYLATSDEMLLIMISEGAPWQTLILCLGYKFAVGLAVGFATDAIIRLVKGKRDTIHIADICDDEKCHCEKGIFRSAIHHTLTITAFIFAVTLAINALVSFIGSDILGDIISKIPVLSHFLAALIGLIPGCSTSVALTTLCTEGIISGGVMMAGLLSASGVGILILTKVNKPMKHNLMIMGLLVILGFVFGLLFDLLGIAELTGGFLAH